MLSYVSTVFASCPTPSPPNPPMTPLLLNFISHINYIYIFMYVCVYICKYNYLSTFNVDYMCLSMTICDWIT